MRRNTVQYTAQGNFRFDKAKCYLLYRTGLTAENYSGPFLDSANKYRVTQTCSLLAETKDQCTQLNAALIYFPERNKNIYMCIFMQGECINLCFKHQYAHSAS
jgi:hypothetical protein